MVGEAAWHTGQTELERGVVQANCGQDLGIKALVRVSLKVGLNQKLYFPNSSKVLPPRSQGAQSGSNRAQFQDAENGIEIR